MSVATYGTWAMLDIDRHAKKGSSSRLLGELHALIAEAMAAAAIPAADVLPSHVQRRVVLGFPDDASHQTVVGKFLDATWRLLDSRNRQRDAHDRLRVTATLHDAGGGSLGEAGRIADAPLLARVLAEARSSSLLISLTDTLYDRVRRPADDYTHVQSGVDTFWIKVPDRSVPPGLLPSDIASSRNTAPAAPASQDHWAGRRYQTVNVRGDQYGDTVYGDKNVGTINYGPPAGRQGGGA